MDFRENSKDILISLIAVFHAQNIHTVYPDVCMQKFNICTYPVICMWASYIWVLAQVDTFWLISHLLSRYKQLAIYQNPPFLLLKQVPRLPWTSCGYVNGIAYLRRQAWEKTYRRNYALWVLTLPDWVSWHISPCVYMHELLDDCVEQSHC